MAQLSALFAVEMVGGEPGWVLLRDERGNSWPMDASAFMEGGTMPSIEQLRADKEFVAAALDVTRRSPTGPSV